MNKKQLEEKLQILRDLTEKRAGPKKLSLLMAKIIMDEEQNKINEGYYDFTYNAN